MKKKKVWAIIRTKRKQKRLGQKKYTGLKNGLNRLNRSEPDRTDQTVNRKKPTYIWFEMGLYMPPVGSTGSGVWARNRTEPMPTPNYNKAQWVVALIS
jgi:hypothetical protein